MLKKLLALLLALSMVFCLFACDDSGKNNDDDDDDDDEEIVDDKDKDNDDKEENKDDEEEEKPTEPDKSAEELLVGSWYFEVVAPADELGMEDYIEDDLTIGMIVTLDEDGTLVMIADEDSMVDFLDELADIMVDMMYDELEAEGLTEEDFEEMIGMTIEEYVDLIMSEAEGELEMEETETTWEVDGNKLILDGELEYEFEVDEYELLLSTEDADAIDEFEALDIELPLILYRMD